MTDIVKRLRDRSDPMTNEIMELAADEIEWLRDENSTLRTNFDLKEQINAHNIEEIERLYKEVANRAHSEEQYRIEIARLREALANRQAEGDAHTLQELRSWQRMAKEIERLRVENEELKHPRCDGDHTAEIERLRECHQLLLMIEATGYLTQGLDSGSTHRAICKKWQRVREALGGHDE